MYNGQKEREANVSHSKRFQKGSSSETKSAPSSSRFKKIQKKKGEKGKCPAVVSKGKGKAKVADKEKSFLCNINGYCKRNCPKYLVENKNEKEGPGISQQNDVSERKNRTLLDMVCSMMNYAQWSSSFWEYVVEIAVHILNNVPSKSVSETPFELWRGRKPS
ncbi:gag/pol protein [Cucumis melo var. makuwa]|uniref:Gag/pol protein n=1 Tax=Cucumis melo var. makuwa TaxID=1194695 RepID=A0A5D3C343_CUCMM|nr:gag/pol protein [Cucumis melo var. makuwa]